MSDDLLEPQVGETPDAPIGDVEPGSESVELEAAPPAQRPTDDNRQRDFDRMQRRQAWAEQQLQQYAMALNQAQQELARIQAENLSPEERQNWEFQQRQQQLQQQEQMLAAQTYANDLWSYYGQFVDPATIEGENPSDWQDSVLHTLTSEIQQLRAENAKLRKARGTAKPTRVTQPGGAPPHKKSVWDLRLDDFENLEAKIMAGQVSPDDFPSI